MADPTKAQYVAAYNAGKQGVADMISSFGLPGWEEAMVDQYITPARVNALTDKIAEAVINATQGPTS